MESFYFSKQHIIIILLLVGNALLFSQTGPSFYDTLLVQNFEDANFEIPVQPPTGFDDTWIIYDQDGFPENCAVGVQTYGFYPEFDLHDDENTTMTSCSFTSINANGDCGNRFNRNWLILSPVFIDNPYSEISWKSAPFLGPMWMDGYKVLISKNGNLPDAFTDTLFVAAETLNSPVPPAGLNPNNYTFSEGYIHADRWSNSQFYSVSSAGFNHYQGRLEPHTVRLDDYEGQFVYVAFLHDSYCNFALQIDDIVIRQSEENSTFAAATELSEVGIFPNPIEQTAQLQFDLKTKTAISLNVLDANGKTVFEKLLGKLSAGLFQFTIEASDWPSGVYFLKIQTEKGVQGMPLVKL